MTVNFASTASPENLMTTNDVPFSTYPDWSSWKATFGSDRNRAPVFVRAGQVVSSGAICRNSNYVISGCGKPCTFCMMAGDGSGCPTSGGHNDISSGLGGNAAFCGSGYLDVCSASGNWLGNNCAMVWARVDNMTMTPTQYWAAGTCTASINGTCTDCASCSSGN